MTLPTEERAAMRENPLPITKQYIRFGNGTSVETLEQHTSRLKEVAYRKVSQHTNISTTTTTTTAIVVVARSLTC